MLDPVPDEPAAVADCGDERALVVADYHAGIEVGLRRDGVELESRAADRRERLLGLLAGVSVDRVVFLGDLGDGIGTAGREERTELRTLLDRVAAEYPVTVAKGNHDGGIEAVTDGVDGVEVTDGDGVRIGDVGFCHGHTWPTDRVAAAPLVFGTAWRMLVTRAELRPGENVLVLGASGGVGHACVQIARNAGATVYATAGSDEKAEAARELGAERVFDYTDENFADAVRDATDGRGVDVVVDHVGKETWRDSLGSLAKGGRLVTCGATTGGDATTDVNRIFWNQLDVLGSTMATRGEVDDVLSLVWDGAFEPRIRARLPMSEAAEGHRMLEERDGFGKVVLVPEPEC